MSLANYHNPLRSMIDFFRREWPGLMYCWMACVSLADAAARDNPDIFQYGTLLDMRRFSNHIHSTQYAICVDCWN
jgi:hypothetical protein